MCAPLISQLFSNILNYFFICKDLFRYMICNRHQLEIKKFLYKCQMISSNMTSAGAGMQRLENGAQNATDLC